MASASGAAGFICERLGPVEADGEHVLAAVARAAAVSRQGESREGQPSQIVNARGALK